MDAAKRENAARRARESLQQLQALDVKLTSTRPLVSEATLVSEAAGLMRAGVPTEIAIESSCATTTPLIRADAVQLMRALLILGSSAGHAMENRVGTLGIHADNIMVSEALAATEPGLRVERFVRITVSDTGRGMAAETQRRAFEPFFSRKFPGKGVGLGLSAAQGIVHGHQCANVAHSAPEAGSRFELHLPCIS